jgi:type IV secretion system protein VirD4
VIERSETIGAGSTGRSVSTSTRWRPILEPAEIRKLPVGTGLLLLRAAAPITMRLRPWTARRDAGELTLARRRWENPDPGIGTLAEREQREEVEAGA